MEVGLREDLAVWNLAHEKLDDEEELLHLAAESEGTELGALPLRLGQVVQSLRILELYSLDPSNIVQVSRVLVV